MGCVKSKVTVVESSTVQSSYQQPRNTIPTVVVPPVKPTKTKKKDSVPTPASFSAIDQHALMAPITVRSSVSSLVQYLLKPVRNDMDMVRVFYRWIADNISYDTDGFFNGTSGPQDCDSVIRRGFGVCAGYANVFRALCSEIGIPCKVVFGFTKAFGYDPEKTFSLNRETTHAWNIVHVNGEWRPLEATWGAGHLDDKNEFVKCFEEVYFLTDPEQFAYEHFPYVDKNLEASLLLQLLKTPVSLDEFSSALCPQTKGIAWGFQCLSHKQGIIEVNKEADIKFTTRDIDLENIICTMVERNTRKNCKQYVLLRKKGNTFSAKVRPPSVGTYVLKLFGKPVRSQGTAYPGLIHFVLRCNDVPMNVRPYPERGGTWGGKHDAMLYGFTKDIHLNDVVTTTNGEVEIRIKTENKPSVNIGLAHAERDSADWKRYAFESYEGKTLVLRARLQEVGFYKLTLFAKHPEHVDKNTYDYVADFLIDCQAECPDMKPFPMAYAKADQYECHLLEPLSGDLPCNQEVRLKMRSEILTRVMVNKEVSKSSGGLFDVIFKTTCEGKGITIYGSSDEKGSLDGLYKFSVV